MKITAKTKLQATENHGEILILPGGKILAHNITPAMAKMLSELNPDDAAMSRRAQQKNNFKNEFPN